MLEAHHLHRAALLVHTALLAAVAGAVGLSPGPRLAVAAAAAAPLLLAVPGLLRRRRAAYQWLAVGLVLYVGAASVEVVAASGQARAAALVLLAALVELGLLLALIRGVRPPRSAE
jgi:uncharacterized membrane protein